MNGNRLYAIGALVALVGVIVAVMRFYGGNTGGRVGVSGTVTHGGKPVENGRIQLRPAEGTSGPVAWGNVEDGRFDITSEDGPVPGHYLATVILGPPPSRKGGFVPAIPSRKMNLSNRSITFPDMIEIFADQAKNRLKLDLH